MTSPDLKDSFYRRTTRAKVFASMLLLLVSLLATWSIAAWAASSDRQSRETPVVRAVKQASPAVVNISTTQVVAGQRNPFRNSDADDPFERFFQEFFDSFGRREYTTSSLAPG
ncbi:MAG: hypothetical protein HQK55_15165 [Deltaproteobacteria bacterium]|nr:hypothetical protein [Deltaproteobacteria bacterium]